VTVQIPNVNEAHPSSNWLAYRFTSERLTWKPYRPRLAFYSAVAHFCRYLEENGVSV
jgi:hypothetical protein